jgi:hypothetical protein
MPRTPNAGSPALWLKVRLGRSRLDHQIALGRSCRGSDELTLRARELCGSRSQHALARNLRRIVVNAERLSARRAITSVVIDAPAVLGDRRAVLALAERFERAAPVNARGVALARQLLGDGRSPLFIGPSAQSVTEAVAAIHEALEERPSRNRYPNRPIRHAAVTRADR